MDIHNTELKNIQINIFKHMHTHNSIYKADVGSPAPSSMCKALLHFTLLPLIHRYVALSRANVNLTLTHPVISLSGFFPTSMLFLLLKFHDRVSFTSKDTIN